VSQVRLDPGLRGRIALVRRTSSASLLGDSSALPWRALTHHTAQTHRYVLSGRATPFIPSARKAAIMNAPLIPPVSVPTTGDNARRWLLFLSRWSLPTALSYLGLIVLFVILVLPAGSGSLPNEFLELDVAGNAPGPYRLTVVFDVLAWLGIGELLLAWGIALRHHAPMRATFISASSAAALIGFFGACLRLSATPELAARYLSTPASDRAALLEAYRELLNLINVTFSAGGLLANAGLLLVAIVTWRDVLPRWVGLLLGLGGGLGMVKAALLLVAGVDLGPVALLGAALLTAGFAGTASSLWRTTPADGQGHPSHQAIAL
jgi:hypothetical protein